MKGRIGNEKVILLKPPYFYEQFRESIVEILNFYKLKPEDLMVIVDDIDIEFAQLKIKKMDLLGLTMDLSQLCKLNRKQKFCQV